MSVTAELADGRKLEFPDGTDPAVVQATVKRLLGTQEPAPQGKRLENEELTATGKFTPSGEKFNLPDIPQWYQNTATGMSGLMRGGANLLSDGLGEKIWPKASGSEGSAGKIVGSIADPVAWAIGGGVAKVLPYAKIGGGAKEIVKALVKNATSGAITGGTIGGLSDEGTAASGATTGALVNTILAPAISGIVRGGRAVKEALYPTIGGLGVKAAGDKSDDVINALVASRSGVPGVNQMAGQASVPANSAEFAALQRLVSEKDPSRYFGPAGVQGQQEGARIAQVQSIGKDQPAIEAAISARRAATNPMRNAAQNAANVVGVSTDKLLRQIRGVESQPGIRASDVVSQSLDKIKEKISKFTNKDGFINAKDLYTIRKELGNTIQQFADASKNWDKRLTGGLQRDLQRNIDDAIEAAGGAGWKDYLAKYAEMSRPIEQMKAGQLVEKALVAPTSGKERVASFGTTLRNPEIAESFTPAQRQVLEAIEANMKQNEQYKTLASAGAKNLNYRIGAPELPPTGFFQPMVSAARGWVNRLVGSGYENALRKGSATMTDPQAMAQAMRDATPKQRAVLEALIGQYLARGATITGATQ